MEYGDISVTVEAFLLFPDYCIRTMTIAKVVCLRVCGISYDIVVVLLGGFNLIMKLIVLS